MRASKESHAEPRRQRTLAGRFDTLLTLQTQSHYFVDIGIAEARREGRIRLERVAWSFPPIVNVPSCAESGKQILTSLLRDHDFLLDIHPRGEHQFPRLAAPQQRPTRRAFFVLNEIDSPRRWLALLAAGIDDRPDGVEGSLGGRDDSIRMRDSGCGIDGKLFLDVNDEESFSRRHGFCVAVVGCVVAVVVVVGCLLMEEGSCGAGVACLRSPVLVLPAMICTKVMHGGVIGDGMTPCIVSDHAFLPLHGISFPTPFLGVIVIEALLINDKPGTAASAKPRRKSPSFFGHQVASHCFGHSRDAPYI